MSETAIPDTPLSNFPAVADSAPQGAESVLKPAKIPGLAPEALEEVGRAVLPRVRPEMYCGPMPSVQEPGKYAKVLPGAVAVSAPGAAVAGFFSRRETQKQREAR